MDAKQAIAALGSLAQDTRLEIFRLLVRHGPEGLAAGVIAERLHVPPATLTFHLHQLMHAGLIEQRRESRLLIYSARFQGMDALMAFLMENCCSGSRGGCASETDCPAAEIEPPSERRRVRR